MLSVSGFSGPMCLESLTVTQEQSSAWATWSSRRLAWAVTVFLPRQKLRGKVAEGDQAPAILLMERHATRALIMRKTYDVAILSCLYYVLYITQYTDLDMSLIITVLITRTNNSWTFC